MMKEVKEISHKELQETRLFKIAMFVVVAMFGAHASFIALFWYLGVKEMAYLNMFFSIPMIMFCFYCVQRKWIWTLAFASFTEILIHAMAAIYFLGWETGFYFYLICALVITQSYPWKPISKFIMACVFGGITISFYLLFHESLYDLRSEMVQGLYLMNLSIFAGLTASYMWYQVSMSMQFEKKLEKANTGLKENNELILEQKTEIEEAHREIKDSINYAKRIQSAILPPDNLIKKHLPNSFVLYKPKDIVAGDFYWLELVKDGLGSDTRNHPDSASGTTPPWEGGELGQSSSVLIAAADCTGHGVPGAMVSVVCNNGLNRSVREFGLTEPGKILDKTRELVIQEFEKSEEEVKDGMDIALVALERRGKSESDPSLPHSHSLSYSGAHNPLWIIRKGVEEVEEIKANKQPIGKFLNPEPYDTHELVLSEGDTVYIFSDGYPDQFGGDRGKKFKSGSFKKLLLSVQNESMEKQKELLDKAFEDWRGDIEQIDDVCVIGIRI